MRSAAACLLCVTACVVQPPPFVCRSAADCGPGEGCFLKECRRSGEVLGRDWSLATADAAFGVRVDHASVIFPWRADAEAMWLIGGFPSSGIEPVAAIFSSVDGIEWSPSPVSGAPLISTAQHTAVVHGGRIWVIGGTSVAGAANQARSWVRASENGSTWTEERSLSAPRFVHASVVFAGRMWIIGGSDGAGRHQNDVLSSEDGRAWETVTTEAFVVPGAANPWQPRSSHEAVVHDGRIFVLGGIDENGNPRPDAWSSADGRTWVRAKNALPPGLAENVRYCVVSFRGCIWVLGGERGARVWSSPDAEEWTLVTSSSPFAGLQGHTCLAFDDALWVIGGAESGRSRAAVWFSRAPPRAPCDRP